MTFVLLVVATVALGTALQRIAGMGLGMVAAPTLSLVLGPVAGVTLSNVAAVVAALMLMAVMWSDIDWRRFRGLAPLMVVGSVVGALVVRTVSSSVLDLVLGASVLLAIAGALGLQSRLHVRGRSAAIASGGIAGFMNTTSGVGGPALAVYGIASRWDQRGMAATLQPIFLLVNLSSVVAKWAVGATPEPGLVPWWIWVLACAAVPLGVAIGTPLARRVPVGRARALTIGIATVGGAIALVRGLVGVLG
jgi:uncharacterized membrane protein YfcA